ncbi:DUF445 domain-containing protein [Flexithrix dorotheae]|uniref:DUF445 domain-containing protein n=1 Tax=Flexithrix dorotheae TaxID=70993 RepID=UPI000382510B|nr:hypothetical protein [Flexithrix dorotheae]
MAFELTSFESLILLSIPITSGIVGWGTNVLALKMTFYPIDFVGIRPIGWQGIIPSKVKKMAEKAVDLLTAKLMKIEEQFDLIDPEVIVKEMEPGLKDATRKIIEEVMVSQIPDLWARSPESLKQTVYHAVEEEFPHTVKDMMKDIKVNINELVDLKKLAVSILTNNKLLVNQIFLTCGEKEFKFIEKSGFYFGFVFGLMQMVAFYFYQPWWFLPLFGFFIGYATNWLALKLIFEPRNPIKIGPLSYQGLFLRRQQEVAREYSSIISEKVVTTAGLFEFMVRGPGSIKMAEIIKDNIEKIVDQTANSSSILIKWIVSQEKLDIIKNIAIFRFKQELPISLKQVFHYAEETLNIRNTLREKMSALSPVEFEGFLRPIFQEDELTLILVGAFLGCFAGFAQYFLLFS